MSNYITSLCSLGYSIQEASKGNILSNVSSIGYATKVVQKLAKDDSFVLGKVAKYTCDTFSKASENNKLLQIAGKGLKIAKMTDPISCLSSMIKTCKSDTPARTFIEESASILGMFFVESLMDSQGKNIAKIKGIKPLNDSFVKFSKNTKYCSQLPAIVYGTLYSMGSDLGYRTFGKMGKWVADKLGLPETEQKTPS